MQLYTISVLNSQKIRRNIQRFPLPSLLLLLVQNLLSLNQFWQISDLFLKTSNIRDFSNCLGNSCQYIATSHSAKFFGILGISPLNLPCQNCFLRRLCFLDLDYSCCCNVDFQLSAFFSKLSVERERAAQLMPYQQPREQKRIIPQTRSFISDSSPLPFP